MGFLDKLKGRRGDLDALKDKAVDYAKEHGEQIDAGIDKAADVADKATKGKYTEKIDGAAAKAKDAADKLDDGRKP